MTDRFHEEFGKKDNDSYRSQSKGDLTDRVSSGYEGLPAPVKRLGPDVLAFGAGALALSWLPIIGPISGGIVGVAVYEYIRYQKSKKD